MNRPVTYRPLRQPEGGYPLELAKREIRIRFSATTPAADGPTPDHAGAAMPARRAR